MSKENASRECRQKPPGHREAEGVSGHSPPAFLLGSPAEAGRSVWRALRSGPEHAFQIGSQLRRRLELRDRIQFPERGGKGIRQTPHRTRLEVFVLRREVQFVDTPCQMFRSSSSSMNARYMINLAVALFSCCARHVSTCRRIGSKFLCIRSTPTEMASTKEKLLE